MCKFTEGSVLTENNCLLFKMLYFQMSNVELVKWNEAIMQMFDWLLCYMLKSSHDKLTQSLKSGKDSFTARNDNQVFFSKTLAIVFIEVILL